MATNLDAARWVLTAHIAAIDLAAPTAPVEQLARAVDEIRRLAQGAGLHPAVTVAHYLHLALSRGERGALVGGWLAMLRDAVDAERHDAVACDAFAAACSIRLAA